MMRGMTQAKSLILEGDIDKVIITIATPLMINNLIRTLYNLTDGLYVARLSSEDFAATAFIWPLNFLFISLGMGIGIGATSLIAQFLGARNDEKADQYVQNSLTLSIVLGALMASIGYFGAPLFLTWMGAEGIFFDKALIYLKISMIGLFFDFVYFGYQSILSAEGKTKTITKISTLSSIVNVLLDPIFIFTSMPLLNISGFGWGIAGAAWATVIAKILLLVLGIVAVKQESFVQIGLRKLQINMQVMTHLLKVGLPSALGQGGAALGFTVLNGLIASYGTDTLAAYSMVNRISDLFTQPQMGIGAALTSIIGQNIGARQYKRMTMIFQRALMMIIGVSVMSSIIIFVFKSQILLIFMGDLSNTRLIKEAIEYLNFTVFIIFFMGMFAAFNGFFQGCGQTQYSMWMSIGRLWIVRLPIIWGLQYFTNLGSTGIWIAMLMSNALTVLYGYRVYRYRNWQSRLS